MLSIKASSKPPSPSGTHTLFLASGKAGEWANLKAWWRLTIGLEQVLPLQLIGEDEPRTRIYKDLNERRIFKALVLPGSCSCLPPFFTWPGILSAAFRWKVGVLGIKDCRNQTEYSKGTKDCPTHAENHRFSPLKLVDLELDKSVSCKAFALL